MHFNAAKQLYVDLDLSKDKIDDIIYHVRNKQLNVLSEYSFKKDVQSILFFSRLLTSIETRYWSIELKIVDFVWILKKIRHLMKFSRLANMTHLYVMSTTNLFHLEGPSSGTEPRGLGINLPGVVHRGTNSAQYSNIFNRSVYTGSRSRSIYHQMRSAISLSHSSNHSTRQKWAPYLHR